jgi:hypothetical protein
MVRPKPRTDPRPSAPAAPTEQRGVPSAYLLLALGLVVFVVSMPRFRSQVVRDNTLGARDMLLLVGEVAEERGHRDVVALLAEEASLRHRLRDARPSATVGRMRVHGYLLDDVTLSDGTAALAAWPLDYGRTGRDAWLFVDGQHLYRHPNGGRWTGEARPLRRVDLADGWQPAPAPVAVRFP